MIGEIDLSKTALEDLSLRLEDKRHMLTAIEKQMDDVSNEIKASLGCKESSEVNTGIYNSHIPCRVGRANPGFGNIQSL